MAIPGCLLHLDDELTRRAANARASLEQATRGVVLGLPRGSTHDGRGAQFAARGLNTDAGALRRRRGFAFAHIMFITTAFSHETP